MARRAKFLCIDVDGVWLVFHLARAGWVTWHDVAPRVPARTGKSGLALRIVLDDGSDPTNAARNARKLVEEDKVDVLMGTSGVPSAIAMARKAGEGAAWATPAASVPMDAPSTCMS